jgi:polysaccharide lyase-like protein
VPHSKKYATEEYIMDISNSPFGASTAFPSRQAPKPEARILAKGLLAGIGFCASLAGAQCPGGGPSPTTLVTENFETEDATCWSSSNSGCGQFGGITSGLTISTSTARGTKSLKVSHLSNETYRHADFQIRPTDTLIYRAYYYFPSGYDFGQGQKIARFFAKGDDNNVYQDIYLQIVSSGGSGAQCGTTDAGTIGLYRTSGPAFTSINSAVSLARGQWHAIKVQLIYNTTGSSNGSATIWVNGAQLAQSTGLNLRDNIPTAIKWSSVQVGGGYSNGGGGNPCPDPYTHAEYYIDDIEVGTNNDVVNPQPSNKELVFYSTLETEDAGCWNPGGIWRSACGAFRGIAPAMTLETNSAYAFAGSKSLKVNHTANETYGHATIGFAPSDTVWYSAQYRFASGFDFGMGMKIARFMTYNGSTLADDMVLQIQSAGGAGAQCGVTAAGQIGIFHNCNPGSSGCATGTGFSPVTASTSGLTLTNWNKFKVRLIFNKVGQSDGSVTLWVNGTQVANATGMTLRGAIPSTVKFNSILTGGWYSNGVTGNTCPDPYGGSTYYHMDDIKISYTDPD